jgi:peptide/nickel transport system permease protein
VSGQMTPIRRAMLLRVGGRSAAGGSRFPWGTGVGVVFVTGVSAAALLAPVVSPAAPEAIDLANAFASQSGAHLLGTDSLGRDLLSRLIWGARASLLGPLLIAALTTVVGTALCLVAAWRGGMVDRLLSALLNVIFSFPSILLAVLVAAVFGKGLLVPVLALAIALLPYFARVVRGAALSERVKPYVESLSAAGFGPFAICLRHLMPNLLPVIATQASLTFGTALGALASLSYLGMGTQPPDSDWGVLIAQGQSDLLAGHPQQTLAAALLVVAVVVTCNGLADRLIAKYRGDER